jgi:Mn2+/Fe2+ NRAMP family transporter
MVVVMLLSANRKVMGEFVIPILLKIFGWTATATGIKAVDKSSM